MPVTRYAHHAAALTHQTAGGAGRSSYVDGDDDSVIQLGTVRDLVVNTRAVIDHDAFAAVTGEMAPTAGDRFKYAAMELDATTGLYYDRARWYDPNGGRFLGQDPLGFAGGDENLYRYVGNSPLNFVDTSGLFGDLPALRMGKGRDGGPINPGYSGNPEGRPIPDNPPFGGRTFRPPTPMTPPTTFDITFGGSTFTLDHPGYTDDADLIDSISEYIVGRPFFPKINGVPFNPMMMGRCSGLGNPFKGKTAGEIDAMFRTKGFSPRGPDPVKGLGGYVDPRTGRSFHIDPQNSFGEPPHIDVNRPKNYKGPLDKKKYEY